ncbi:MAG TPA: dephospho-CoA kinase [Thermotogota bacterium]|nr:dephospho-CoA kinase [Thermotogota bacterium]
MQKKISVGITGLMGSGKSEVARYLMRTGYPVLFMDRVGHDCLGEKDVVNKLTSCFKQHILDESQKIDRKKLSKIVFVDQKKLALLNSILHPIMNEEAKKWIIKHHEKGDSLVFIEAAVLFEMKMELFLDYTVLIQAAEKEIIKRIIQRDRKTLEETKLILDNQRVDASKVDYVIYNMGTLEELQFACHELLYWLDHQVIK